MPEPRNLQARIDEELPRFLKMIAARDKLTLSALVNQVVRIGLESYEAIQQRKKARDSK